VVIRNAGELMSRDSLTMRSGTVQLAVLPAIDVSRWKLENLDKHVAEVRDLYLSTLENWPTASVSE
jgi:putative phosphoserine phosphatase/1-acylglycerol-3-phosphate O-acyltransferase